MLDGTESVLIREVYQYWMQKRGDRAAPPRADIDPIEMRVFLPNVVLLDVEQSPRRYRTRLMGTAFVEEYGEDTTGRYLDEVDLGQEKQRLFTALDAVVASCTPTYMKPMENRLTNGRLIRFERIVMPLSNDGTTVNMLLICLIARDLSKSGTKS